MGEDGDARTSLFPTIMLMHHHAGLLPCVLVYSIRTRTAVDYRLLPVSILQYTF
jgi:sulfite exporter TauE/SafE